MKKIQNKINNRKTLNKISYRRVCTLYPKNIKKHPASSPDQSTPKEVLRVLLQLPPSQLPLCHPQLIFSFEDQMNVIYN